MFLEKLGYSRDTSNAGKFEGLIILCMLKVQADLRCRKHPHFYNSFQTSQEFSLGTNIWETTRNREKL